MLASETGHVYTYASEKLKPFIASTAIKDIIQVCLNSPDHEESVGEAKTVNIACLSSSAGNHFPINQGHVEQRLPSAAGVQQASNGAAGYDKPCRHSMYIAPVATTYTHAPSSQLGTTTVQLPMPTYYSGRHHEGWLPSNVFQGHPELPTTGVSQSGLSQQSHLTLPAPPHLRQLFRMPTFLESSHYLF
jgi:hypothetical protein